MLKRSTVFILMIAILSLLLLPACGKRDKEGMLSARFDGSTLVWDSYDGAATYSVKCTLTDGTGYSIKTKDTSYAPPSETPGNYLYVVSALDSSGKVIARSESLAYHLGKGSPADPIDIASAEDLLAITGSTTLTFGKVKITAPLSYRLTADIDLTDKEITPIGNTNAPFQGVFDGNGHTITGLSLKKSNTDGAVALFGAIKNATVKNLTLKNASLLFDKDSGVKGGALRFGLLVGSAVSSQVDNCHVTGEIDVLSKVITRDDTTLSVGGVIGLVNSGRVSGCSFTGSVSAQYGIVYAGGIVGEAKGSSPDFLLLNSMAHADITAVGTAYDVTTGSATLYARAGVLVGSISHTGRLASLLAVGSATAKTTRDGVATNRLTAGVFGKTSSNTNSVNDSPMMNIFYSESISKVSGSANSLGTYAKNVHPLSEEAMKTQSSYLVGESYGLDFDHYWSIAPGEIPSLKKQASLYEPTPLGVNLRSESEDLTYDFSLESTFRPSYYPLALLRATEYYLGYKLSDLLDKLNLTVDAGTRLRFSAEGKDPVTLTVGQSKNLPYLVYGVHAAYERPADLFGGYKIIDIQALKTYDFTDAKAITITILPAESTEA